LVRYRFDFLLPTATPPVVNTAAVGRTIPIRWLTRDAIGVRITDPSHFIGISVRQVPCPIGATTNPIAPSVEPPVGLTLLTGSLWEYGWDTRNSIRTQGCQEVTVNLKDGVSDRVALFQFSKKEKKE
jgi:hypothetical protein